MTIQCCLCDSWLPWTSLMLESHLKDKHRSTPAEYARGNAERILRQMESFENADAAKPDTKSVRLPSSSDWFDQCMYKCGLCDYQGCYSVMSGV